MKVQKKDQMSPFAQELKRSMEEGLTYLKGEGPARVTRMTLPDPPPSVSRQQIRDLRQRFEMTQVQFARLVNVSPKPLKAGNRRRGFQAVRP